MIQIDMQMPKNCLDCPACNEYLTCAIPVNGRKWGENDVREFGQGRPEWCPMKEQEAVVPGADSGMCEICSFYERSLPVKPHYNARTNWYECGACHYSMTSGMHCRNELIPAYKVGFCAKCGKGVMWK